MPDINVWQAFGVALVGGLTVKIIDIGYQEIRRWSSDSKSEKNFVDDHLDPLLKAADELNGKIRALAESDFKSIRNVDVDKSALQNHEFVGVIFLFGRFWAQIEILRKKGLSTYLSNNERGARLQSFFDCLESRRVRIIDRMLQRAIGEIFLKDGRLIDFMEFSVIYDDDKGSYEWIKPLESFLARMNHTRERQKLLQYGVVIHAIIDNLDEKHMVSRERPGWPNKLTRKSWQDLKYRVFKVYLNFVQNTDKYLGPPKKAARKRNGKGSA